MPCGVAWSVLDYLTFLRANSVYAGIAIAGDSGCGKTSASRGCRLSPMGRKLVTHLELDQWVPAHPICSISPYPIPAMLGKGLAMALSLGRVPIVDFASIDDPIYLPVLEEHHVKLLTFPHDSQQFCEVLETTMVAAINYRSKILKCTACEV